MLTFLMSSTARMYEAQERLSRAGFHSARGQRRVLEAGSVLDVDGHDQRADEVRAIVLSVDPAAKERGQD